MIPQVVEDTFRESIEAYISQKYKIQRNNKIKIYKNPEYKRLSKQFRKKYRHMREGYKTLSAIRNLIDLRLGTTFYYPMTYGDLAYKSKFGISKSIHFVSWPKMRKEGICFLETHANKENWILD